MYCIANVPVPVPVPVRGDLLVRWLAMQLHAASERESDDMLCLWVFLKSSKCSFRRANTWCAAACPRYFTIAIDDRRVPSTDSTRTTLPCRATTSSFADWRHAVSARVRSDAYDELKWNGTEGRFCEFDRRHRRRQRIGELKLNSAKLQILERIWVG